MKAALQTQSKASSTAPAIFAPVRRSLLQRKCACGGTPGPTGECEACRKKRETGTLQRAADHPSSVRPHPPQAPPIAEEGLRSPRFGHDFSQVRVREAAPKGMQASLTIGQPNDKYEQEADRVADAVMRMPTKCRATFNTVDGERPAAGSKPLRREGTEMGDDAREQTIHSGTTSGNSFSAIFDPTTTNPPPDCDRIVITQSIRMFADGKAIMPGTYYSPFKCRDATALADATYLDHGKCSYTTPYPVDRGIGTAGKSNASGTGNATYSDAPTTGGGDKGFKSASNPGGWDTVNYYFKSYALCAKGRDCAAGKGPIWYDGVAWEYTKTAADHAAGAAGVATATASLSYPSAGTTIINAFDKYNTAKGFTPC